MTKDLPPPLAPDAQRGQGDSSAPPDYTRQPTPPPAYSHQPRPSDAFPDALADTLAHLDLGRKTHKPSADECIAHLKFLAALAALRDDVCARDGVFDIAPPAGERAGEPLLLARVREKRWAVFVARAVDRFEAWWRLAVPRTTGGEERGPLTAEELTGDREFRALAGEVGVRMAWPDEGNMPPLDVLMVWHAYLLNPRGYFEDCLRYGKLDFWATGFPWRLVNAAVDGVTFEYEVSSQAKAAWKMTTGHQWDNLQDSPDKSLRCPLCPKAHYFSIPWCRQAGYVEKDSDEFFPGTGYADKDFLQHCEQADLTLNHDMLRVLRFRSDVQQLLTQDVPLPGCVLSHEGKPPLLPTRTYTTPVPSYFPSGIIKAGLYRALLGATDPSADLKTTTMETIKEIFQAAIKEKQLIKQYKVLSYLVTLPEKRALRRMMSRYWFNSSPFALDLVGAVIRQGTFIDKMQAIDWLHSPSLRPTMDRLIVKYVRFFRIMAAHPNELAVPTLDVDLAWHTHQTVPQSYYAYSDYHTGRLIDHDDKIEENDLDTAFERTSKRYQQAYGEPYSACTCWYCEAVRESHTSTFSRLFKTNNAHATDTLHDSPDNTTTPTPLSSDPQTAPHISTHPAIRTPTTSTRAALRAASLNKAHAAATRRALKANRAPPPRDDAFTASAWGYTLGYPYAYVPYGVAPAYAGGGECYVDGGPGWCETGDGAYGSCAAGTCGGLAAAGGCAGVGGGACGSAGGGCGGAGGGCGGGGGGGGGCGGGGGGGGGCGGC